MCDAADSDKNPSCIDYSDATQSKLYQCVTFKGKVANYQTEIVIDSGSGITVMSLELCNLINKYAKQPLEISHKSVSARTAKGENVDVIGTTSAELVLNDGIWYVDCYVVRNFKFSFLLGSDFLIRTCKNLDLGSKQVKIGQQVIPVSVVKRPSQHRVCVAGDSST